MFLLVRHLELPQIHLVEITLIEEFSSVFISQSQLSNTHTRKLVSLVTELTPLTILNQRMGKHLAMTSLLPGQTAIIFLIDHGRNANISPRFQSCSCECLQYVTTRTTFKNATPSAFFHLEYFLYFTFGMQFGIHHSILECIRSHFGIE